MLWGKGVTPSSLRPRYASLYFCCAIEGQDNELITLELIHRYVELLDKYFGSVSPRELRLSFHALIRPLPCSPHPPCAPGQLWATLLFLPHTSVASGTLAVARPAC